MSYVEKTRMPDEQVLFQTRMHWVVFLPPVRWLIFACFSLAVGHTVRLLHWRLFFDWPLYLSLTLGCMVLFALSLLGAWLDYLGAEYALTDKRVIMKQGLIRRRAFEIMLSRIESVVVNQSILGRLLNYGSVMMYGTGGGCDPFHRIPAPLAFRNRVQTEVIRAMRGYEAVAPSAWVDRPKQ